MPAVCQVRHFSSCSEGVECSVMYSRDGGLATGLRYSHEFEEWNAEIEIRMTVHRTSRVKDHN